MANPSHWSSQLPSANSRKPAVMIVHDAWHVPDHYEDFTDRLEAAGFEVYCPLLPTMDADDLAHITMGLDDDVRVIRDFLVSLVIPETHGQPAELPTGDDLFMVVPQTAASVLQTCNDVIMLLHGYGGAVGTEAVRGLSKTECLRLGLPVGGVIHLIYMCAFMLQPAECVGDASSPVPLGHPILKHSDTGATSVRQPADDFLYGDLPPERAEEMGRLLVSQAPYAMSETITHPAWQHIPTTYIKTYRDRFVLPQWQQRMITAVQGAGVDIMVEHLEYSSHSPFLSHSERVVQVVERAASRVWPWLLHGVGTNDVGPNGTGTNGVDTNDVDMNGGT
ncbi:MAG: hypothetical protein Q9218_001752 [Villophora microphyllina]